MAIKHTYNDCGKTLPPVSFVALLDAINIPAPGQAGMQEG